MKVVLFLTFLFLLTINSLSAVRTWDGGGADANWLTAANWSEDVAPAANDDLVFPAAAAQFTTNNNFPLFTTFRTITFDGGAYAVGGNVFRLTNGLTVNEGTQSINAVLTMAAPQTFTATSASATATVAVLSLGSNALTIDGAGNFGVGLISGSGAIAKNGFGAVLLAANGGFNGPITLNGGTFVVDATITGSTVTVNSGVIGGGQFGFSGFGGTGTVGETNVIAGVISAGTLTSPTGILNIQGRLTLSPNTNYACKIGGTTPGSGGHDQLLVSGTISLNNARLVPIPFNGFRPAIGDSFMVLRNAGTIPTSGMFGNAPDGSTFGGALNTAFRITYNGGDGNDVVITRVPRSAFDFDGDGRSDISAFLSNTWHVRRSNGGGVSATSFGLESDLLAPADFDGDNRSDLAVFRPSIGVWYVLNSSNATLSITQFGAAGDLPTPNDFDGDGRSDITVFRPSNGGWYQLRSLTNDVFARQYGTDGDKPQVADFDGDGIGDLAVFRPSNGVWYFLQSSDDSSIAFPWGISTDRPVPADYDGDGRTDAAVFRATAAGDLPDFYILRSSNFRAEYGFWGLPGDLPVVGDYDGDGRADLAVVRPDAGQSVWYLLRSTAGFEAQNFVPGNRPIPEAYVR